MIRGSPASKIFDKLMITSQIFFQPMFGEHAVFLPGKILKEKRGVFVQNDGGVVEAKTIIYPAIELYSVN